MIGVILSSVIAFSSEILTAASCIFSQFSFFTRPSGRYNSPPMFGMVRILAIAFFSDIVRNFPASFCLSLRLLIKHKLNTKTQNVKSTPHEINREVSPKTNEKSSPASSKTVGDTVGETLGSTERGVGEIVGDIVGCTERGVGEIEGDRVGSTEKGVGEKVGDTLEVVLGEIVGDEVGSIDG